MVNKLFGVMAAIALAGWILATSIGCSPVNVTAAHGNNDSEVNDVVVPNREMVEELVSHSSTYRFDGLGSSIKLISANGDAADRNWEYVIEYQTTHAGHGDRTGHMMAQVITNHRVNIAVTNGEIMSAVCDDSWDMVKD